jgi:hypothetical protein
MLHGSVLSAENAGIARAVVGNTPVFNDSAQIMNTSPGITLALLNQPVFDSVRAVADRAYAYGHIKRDFILARPEESIPGYFVIMDNISEIDFDTAVNWRVHGRGATATSLDQRIIWQSSAFGPPRLRSIQSILEIVFPIGMQGKYSTTPGIVRSRFPFSDKTAQSVQVELTGGGRILSILIPHGEKERPPAIEAQGEYVCLIGTTDLFGFGGLARRITSGSFEHISEYSLVRVREKAFPALTMGFGVECRLGDHLIKSDKPISASLDGLSGSLQNEQSETRVTIQSPEIKTGARYLIGGRPVAAEKPGILEFILSEPGTHSLSQ